MVKLPQVNVISTQAGIQRTLELNASSSKPLLWALVDCNSFYCSCERIFRPDLQNKPVVVLSNNDGCLIALTPEAKALGFRMGDVFFKVKNLLALRQVAVFSSNYALYGDISNRVMQCLKSLVPVDQYSIDEAFIPFSSSLAVQAADVGRAIHERVMQWVGMPVRVGIGPTRTLAKLANNWSKRLTRVLQLETGTDKLEQILEKTPVADVWGIGRRQAVKLSALGITTAKKLRDMDLDWALKLLTVVGQRTILELRGFQCVMEDNKPIHRKSLINTRSFGRRVSDKSDLAEALSMHCAIAAERLRLEKMEAGILAVHFETSRHDVSPYYKTGASINLKIPTNITSELVAAAGKALDKCYSEGHDFMKGGIMLYELQPQESRQLTLAEACPNTQLQRKKDLMKAMDSINDKYGAGALRSFSQGAPDAFWHMRQDRKSKSYTTRWSELPSALAK